MNENETTEDTAVDEPVEQTDTCDGSADDGCEEKQDTTPGDRQRAHRLQTIIEGKDEGLSDAVIGDILGIDSQSVSNIWGKYRQEIEDRPHRFDSSIGVKLEHHTPDEFDIVAIEKLRAAADVFAQQLDRIRKNPREVAVARTNLEQSLMWATKAVALPFTSEG